MAIWGSLTTSGMALNAHGHQMQSIGDNIANLNTIAYKQVDTHYQTQLGHGTPKFNFFGVATTDVRRVNEQGPLVATGRNLDAAINGSGFFVTNSSPDGRGTTYYTRDGSFEGRALNADGTPLTSTGTTASGNEANYMITRAGDYVMGWQASADGTSFNQTLSAVNFAPYAVVPGIATTRVGIVGNVSASDGTGKTVHTTLPIVHVGTDPDPLKAAKVENLNLNFTPVTTPPVPPATSNANTWTVSASGAATATVTPPTVVFRGDGPISTPQELQIALTWADGTSQTVTLDMTKLTQYKDSKQDFSLTSLERNGQLAGQIKDVNIDSRGVIWGNYSNQSSRPLYKLPIATFPSPNYLEAVSGNRFMETERSGTAVNNELVNGNSIAEIQPSTLERANVVLEDQFSKMIITQRAYSTAATVFRTSDEMLQEIKNLKS